MSERRGAAVPGLSAATGGTQSEEAREGAALQCAPERAGHHMSEGT
jgi:hypothetical protein